MEDKIYSELRYFRRQIFLGNNVQKAALLDAVERGLASGDSGVVHEAARLIMRYEAVHENTVKIVPSSPDTISALFS